MLEGEGAPVSMRQPAVTLHFGLKAPILGQQQQRAERVTQNPTQAGTTSQQHPGMGPKASTLLQRLQDGHRQGAFLCPT